MAAIIRARHAISFQLLNKDGQSVLGIFDPQKGQTSTLELTNSARLNWKLKPLSSSEPSATNHHFELKFRPGTLNLSGTTPITVDAGTAGWRISSRPIETDGGVSLYLLSTNPSALESGKSVLESGKTTVVKVNNINADGSGGGRGARVELKWGTNVEYVGGTQQLVAGHRVQHLTIVNQRGEKNIPLHVGFSVTNQVLNNGTPNTLRLRITNAGQGSLNIIPEGDLEYSPTKFIVSFAASDRDWTLAPLDAVNAFEVKAKFGDTELNVKKEGQGQTTEWIIWHNKPPRLELKPGNFIEVTISNIKTSYQSGPTNLYLRYKNIPGYWDGDFMSVIEKSPVVSKGQLVGVGMNDPQTRLHVKGNTRIEGDVELHGGYVGIGTTASPQKLSVTGDLRVEKGVSVGSGNRFDVDSAGTFGGRLRVTSEGNVGIATDAPQSRLHVNGDVRLEKNKEIYFVDNGQIRSADDAHRILFRRENYNVLELREYGHIVFSPGAEQGTETAKMIIRNSGSVGIGTTDPSKTLHVVGGLRVENEVSVGGGFDFEVDAPGVHGGRFKVKQDGRVGIGTHDPTKAKLEVSGWFYGATGKFAYLNSKGVTTGGDSSPNDYSIWASNRMAASEFNAFSDERMKNIQGRSDSAMDLCTLLGIEITDYSYKDVIGKGNGAYKKVIGQKIERVFPQAVSRVTDVVPDIYQQASIQDGWVALATDLKKGERVKLITETGENVHEVLEVTPNKFRVDFEHEEDQVFVFGRQVNDFLTVDYDAISTLNVSATQQLKKELDHEVKALRAENAELRAVNDALAQRLQLLESKLEMVLGVMSAANGSNGNGKHSL